MSLLVQKITFHAYSCKSVDWKKAQSFTNPFKKDWKVFKKYRFLDCILRNFCLVDRNQRKVLLLLPHVYMIQPMSQIWETLFMSEKNGK